MDIVINGYTGVLHDGFVSHTLVVALMYSYLGYEVIVLADQEIEKLERKLPKLDGIKKIKFQKRPNALIKAHSMRVLSLIANNDLHRKVYEYAELNNDIVILHDPNLFWLEGNKEFNAINQNVFTDALVRSATYKYYNKIVEKSKIVAVYSEVMAGLMGLYATKKPCRYLALVDNNKYLHSTKGLRQDITDFNAKTKFGIVGYLTPSKHIVEIIEAFALYKKIGGDGVLYILGKGDYIFSEIVKNRVEVLGLGGVHLEFGYINENEFSNKIREIDVQFNVRYCHSGEASGVMNNESMRDKIIIGTEIGGHEKTTNFIGIDSPLNLVEKLSLAMLNAERLRLIKTLNAKNASENCVDFNKHSRQYLELLGD
jgi:glycosyltransferase involved in cell wall biosynthesis